MKILRLYKILTSMNKIKYDKQVSDKLFNDLKLGYNYFAFVY